MELLQREWEGLKRTEIRFLITTCRLDTIFLEEFMDGWFQSLWRCSVYIQFCVNSSGLTWSFLVKVFLYELESQVSSNQPIINTHNILSKNSVNWVHTSWCNSTFCGACLRQVIPLEAKPSFLHVCMCIHLAYSMAQQPLKSFDSPLMRVSLSNSILVTLVFY